MGTEETSTTSTTAAEEPPTTMEAEPTVPHVHEATGEPLPVITIAYPLQNSLDCPQFDEYPGRHPRGCSRVLFLVEGPPFRAAAAALMGMVFFPVTSTPASHQNSIKLNDTIVKCERSLLSVLLLVIILIDMNTG